ncbi:phage tail protein, partial [Psittacicella hinzii]|uniref:phage tail protein n=1 Tax=Psittacicella hinzii TaxID=2028575 RepID=UPI003610C31F
MQELQLITNQQEQRLAAEIANYPPSSLFGNSVSQYNTIARLSQEYVKKLDDLFSFSEVSAIEYLKQNFGHTYFQEYGKAFIDCVQYMINKGVADAQAAFNKRPDVIALTASIEKYTPRELYVFSTFFPWVKALNSTVIDTALLDYYRNNFLDRNQKSLDKILNDLLTYLKILYSIGGKTIAKYVSQESKLNKLIRNASIYPPNGTTVSFTGKNAGFAILPETKLPNGGRTLRQVERVVDIISVGPIHGLVDGMTSVFYNDTPYISKTNGTRMVANVQADFREGEAVQSASDLSYFPSIAQQVNRTVTKSTPITAVVNFPDCTYVQAVLSVPQLTDATIDVKVVFEVTLSNGGTVVRDLGTQTISGKWSNDKEFPYTYRLGADETFPVTITVSRTNSEILDDDNKVNDLSFSRAIGIADSSPVYPGYAYVASAWDNTGGTDKEYERKFEIYGRKIKIPSNYNPWTRTYEGDWDGEFKKELSYCNNPAWIIYDLLTDYYIGLGAQLPVEKIDKYSFYNCGKYCDELVNGEPRWAYNGVINKSTSAFKLIKNIAATCRANVINTDDGLKMIIERPQEAVYLFSNANVIGGEFNRNGSALRTRNKRIGVSFTDPNNNYKSNTVYVNDLQHASDYRAEKKVTLAGCTSEEQAARYGRFLLAVEKFETSTISFNASYDALEVELGDVVRISDYAVSNMKTNGRVSHVSVSGKTCNVFLDIVDPELFKLKQLQFLVNSDLGLVLYSNLTLKSQTNKVTKLTEYYVTVGVGENNFTPQPGQSYTLFNNDFEPELFRITDKSISSDRKIAFSAQKYSPDKFAISDGVNKKGSGLFSVEHTPSTLYTKLSQLRNLKVTHKITSEKPVLEIKWDDPSHNAHINYNVVVRSASGDNILFSKTVEDREAYYFLEVDTKTEDIEVLVEAYYFLEVDTKTEDIEVLVFPIINGIIDQADFLSQRLQLDLDNIKPSKPRISRITVNDDATRTSMPISMIVDYSDVKNASNIKGFRLLLSADEEALKNDKSELITGNTDDIVVFNYTGRPSNIRFTLNEAQIKKLKLQDKLLVNTGGVFGSGKYYRDLFIKVIPLTSSALDNVHVQAYKANGYGVTRASIYTSSHKNPDVKVFFHNTNPNLIRLDFTTSAGVSSVNQEPEDKYRIHTAIKKYTLVTFKIHGEVYGTASEVASSGNESVQVALTESLYRIRELKKVPANPKIEVITTSCIGREDEINHNFNLSDYAYTPERNVITNGTGVFLEIVTKVQPEEWVEALDGKKPMRWKWHYFNF